jgi:hypothetical protein
MAYIWSSAGLGRLSDVVKLVEKDPTLLDAVDTGVQEGPSGSRAVAARPGGGGRPAD